jgi:hypothetical protein
MLRLNRLIYWPMCPVSRLPYCPTVDAQCFSSSTLCLGFVMIPGAIFNSENEQFCDSVRKFLEQEALPFHSQW